MCLCIPILISVYIIKYMCACVCTYICIILIIIIEFFDLQAANSPSKLRLEANLSREDSQSTKQSKAKEDF